MNLETMVNNYNGDFLADLKMLMQQLQDKENSDDVFRVKKICEQFDGDRVIYKEGPSGFCVEMKNNQNYFYVDSEFQVIGSVYNKGLARDMSRLSNGNFYLDEEEAEKAARADSIIKRLKKFADTQNKLHSQDDDYVWTICYEDGKMRPTTISKCTLGQVAFNRFGDADRAISIFKNLLEEYFKNILR